MAKDDPLPDHDSLKCLQADDSFVDFLGRNFPAKHDNQLKRAQSAILAAAAPPLNLWRELHDQGLDRSPDSLIPVGTVLESIQNPWFLLVMPQIMSLLSGEISSYQRWIPRIET